jgi:DNA-binding transcriptional MocR family regulator
MATEQLSTSSFLVQNSNQTLVEQIVAWFAARIDERVYRVGAKLPSIRDFAQRHAISRFTVVEAYDRLVARGYVESRKGSGFYVTRRAHAGGSARAGRSTWVNEPNRKIDVVWMLRNLFASLPVESAPGAGTLPPSWLDAELISASLRSVGRVNGAAFLGYGEPQGYLPLRQQLSVKMAEIEVFAAPEQILTVNGVTQGLDLVAQHFLRPGDTVFVDQPSWFLMFGRFALLGVKIVGIPRLDDGPNIELLRQLAAVHKPKLYVVISVLHNPMATSLSAAKAYRILQAAQEFDFHVVEDDVYGDLHPGASFQPVTRLAALDQWQRVIYLASFSKTLAANLRVGYMAADPELIRSLTDLKMLGGLTASELGERVVYKVLSEGHYRRHLERLRNKLHAAREPALRMLERIGLRPGATGVQAAGMFTWVDTGVDTLAVAQRMAELDYLVAPGSLFLPDQGPSTWMRFNIATCTHPPALAALERCLAR